MRRLMLTGGLILIDGKTAVAQIFLGIMISTTWLLLVVNFRPYKEYWESIMSSLLSFTLVLTMVTGVCLRLHQLSIETSTVNQRAAFDIMMMIGLWVSLVLSIVALIISTPCLRKKVFAQYKKCRTPKPKKVNNADIKSVKVSPEALKGVIDDRRIRLRAIFDRLDVDNNGTLERNEILGASLTDPELAQYLSASRASLLENEYFEHMEFEAFATFVLWGNHQV
jgi:hypothetical protein